MQGKHVLGKINPEKHNRHGHLFGQRYTLKIRNLIVSLRCTGRLGLDHSHRHGLGMFLSLIGPYRQNHLNSLTMTIPTVFISYSHESQKHKKWVLDFATRLRQVGVDASLDQWDLGAGDDIPIFMERHLASADRVLMICTEVYVNKANSGTGGVGYEKMIVTADLMRSIDSNKVIPIIRQDGTYILPTFLHTKYFLDFSREDQYELSFDNLTRTLHNAPLFIKPEISNNPFKPISTGSNQSGDALKELMSTVVSVFESMSEGYVDYPSISGNWRGSRIMLDLLLDQAVLEGLIARYTGGYIDLTPKGKLYAIENELIN